ncbi:UNVERIFIED_CONTAM: hypothetical protein HDU68_012860 [Siphonaria sp. JEL0065]|nr:hypothetical protein HDU68_012860 [Siphonaria sp. JEL0065]
MAFKLLNQPAAASGFNQTLAYHGGRILANTEVFAVFYPSSYGPVPLMNETLDFYNSITNSPWWDIMSQYSTPTQQFGNGKLVGSYLETGSTKNYLDDVPDVQPYIRGLIKSGVIKPNNNTYVVMHYGPYIQVVAGGLGSCGFWCGYHNSMSIGDLVPGIPELAYGGIPDFFVGGGCDRCVGTDQLGKTLSTAAHEIAEATLDPYGDAWDEIGDPCSGENVRVTARNGHVFEVQQLFSNLDNRCVSSQPNIPSKSTTTTTVTVASKTAPVTSATSLVTMTTTTTTSIRTSDAVSSTSITTTTTKLPASTSASTIKTTSKSTPKTTTITTTDKPTTTGNAGSISNGVTLYPN